MGRLIELGVAIDTAIDAADEYDGGYNFERHKKIRDALMALPTVDAVPVVHGHWKEDPSGYGFWICSACGFVSEASAADVLYKFCPNCGADMRKDGGNNG